MSDVSKPKRRGNGEGSLVYFRDAHGRDRYRIGISPPPSLVPPLPKRQRWKTLDPGTQETKAKNTFASWVEKIRENPMKYVELFELEHLLRRTSQLADPTLAEFGETYFGARKTRNNKSERQFFRNHIVPELGPRPMKDIRVDEIRGLFGIEGKLVAKGLSNKSVCDGYGLVRTMYKRAIRDDKERTDRTNQARVAAEKVAHVIFDTPCVLRGDELPDKDVLSARSRTPGAYTRVELVSLISDERIPLDRLILHALMLLTGMRHGEASGLKWKMIDEQARPLWAIDLRTQYDGKPLKGKGQAGGNPREIPVHPVLAIILAEWKREGFAKIYGRAPMPDDYVVPTRRRGKRAMSFRKPHASLESHTRDCEAIGIAPRRVHDMRHTFISLARGDGADRDILEKVTHNAKGKMIDHYTHLDFTPKCRAVAALRLDLSATGGPCWPPQQLRSRYASEGGGEENALFFPGKLATPTGIEPVLPT